MTDAVIMDSETVESSDVLMEKFENEDLLMDILAYLPPKSIFRFMSVSKRWRKIIRHPFFLQRYSAAASRRRRCGGDGGRLLAFFQAKPRGHCHTLAIPIPGLNIINSVPTKFGGFFNSSNGLILCGFKAIYHVINPVTGKHVQLPRQPPPPPNLYNRRSAGIMCEENTAGLLPVYTVVCFAQKDNLLYMDTYSSRTGGWSNQRVVVAADGVYTLGQQPPVVANGVFHWCSAERCVAVYDPNDGESHVQVIKVPHFGSEMFAVTRSADDDLLWLGLFSRGKMQFFALPKGEDGSYNRETAIGHDEWVLMYDISVDSIGANVRDLNPWNEIGLESIISTWDSEIVAVLRQEGKVFLYGLESKSIERVRYYGRYYDNYHENLCPYVESSFLSSYTL